MRQSSCRLREEVGYHCRGRPAMYRKRIGPLFALLILAVVLLVTVAEETAEEFETVGTHYEPVSQQEVERKEETHHPLLHEQTPGEVDGTLNKSKEDILDTEQIAAKILLEQKDMPNEEEHHQQDKEHVTNNELPVATDEIQEQEHVGDEEIGQSAAKDEDEEEDEEENPEDYYFYAFDEKSVVIEQPRYDGDPDLAPFIRDPSPGEIRIVEFYAHW
jgi:hypothetical protein